MPPEIFEIAGVMVVASALTTAFALWRGWRSWVAVSLGAFLPTILVLGLPTLYDAIWPPRGDFDGLALLFGMASPIGLVGGIVSAVTVKFALSVN